MANFVDFFIEKPKSLSRLNITLEVINDSNEKDKMIS